MNDDTVRLVHAAPQTSGKATASLVLGLSSFLCWIFTGLPAIVLGIIALRDIKRSGGRLQGDGMAIAGIVTGGITSVLIIPMLFMVALLLPAIQAAREAARRTVATNNMKQIMLGMLNYESSHRTFPATSGSEGKGLQLSWRVHLLPYLEEGGAELYKQFHLDEPWDSEHNRTLIENMPDVFKDPADRLPPGKTAYLAVTGPGTAFGDGKTGPKVREFRDGLSRTFTLVEVDPDQAVVWTKPEDWKYDPTFPTRGLGSMRVSGFLAATGDGAVHLIYTDMPEEVIKAMMTRDGDEGIDIQLGW